MPDIKQKKPSDVLKIGTFLMFVSLLFLTLYLLISSKINLQVNKADSNINKIDKSKQETENQVKQEWTVYENTDYDFRLEHPKFLYDRVYKDQGGYKLFVRFEETKFSIGKGVAIGVKEISLERESELIKAELTDQGADLTSEDGIEVDGIKGYKLTFTPKGEGEKRSVVLVTKDKYTFSISTTPEQIDRVIQSFEFI